MKFEPCMPTSANGISTPGFLCICKVITYMPIFAMHPQLCNKAEHVTPSQFGNNVNVVHKINPWKAINPWKTFGTRLGDWQCFGTCTSSTC